MYIVYAFSEASASTTILLLHKFCPINSWPQNRRENQNYMMHTVESPTETLLYYDKNLLTNKFFNSSATYRVDSSVFMPYDALTKITPTTPKEYIWNQKEVLAKVMNKTKLAFQAISHCNANSSRDPITKRLQELIGLDVVGECYGGRCSSDCYKRNMENHMFYLALENNICHNYVTEKFWNSLRSLTVPVVFSRPVLKGMDVPSNAFIALDDFKSVNEFSAYLKALQNDTERYLK
uniref:Fucosyltransferase n=1 Tax=Meloidogyne incognita TaxID=6306 RepID=A0A914LL52_MELIC